MYICEVCNTQTGPLVPCNIVPVETREKTYTARYDVGDPGGTGHEIVKEHRACPSCADGNLA